MTATPDQATNSPAAKMTAASFRGRRCCCAFLCAFFVTLTAAYAINIYGNAEDIFPFGPRKSRNERGWKARRLAALVAEGHAPEALILGSSRVMQMSPEQVRQLTGEPAFNLAVRGADMLVCSAMLRYAIAIGAAPKTIVISIDEQMFPPGRTRQHRLAGNVALFRALPIGDQVDLALAILKKLNLRETAKSAKALLGLRGEPPKELPVLVHANGILMEDGYLVKPINLGRDDRSVGLEERIDRMIVDKRRIGAVLPSGPFTLPELSPDSWWHLIDLFDTARDLNCRVYVVTTPNHHGVADSEFGEERRRLLPELRRCLEEECGKRGFIYRDFSDVATFEGDENGFWDGIHQTPENLQRMTNVLFGKPADSTISLAPGDEELVEHVRTKWGLTIN